VQEIRQIGDVEWSREEIKSSIPEFLDLYNSRPILDNEGGMKSPHMFATWFILKKLNPVAVVESGIWKGQSTWLIEITLPEAKIYSIDLNLNRIQSRSDRVTYFDKDFSKINWSFIEDKENTLLFFDDHQNAFERIKLCKELGFKQFIFDDNYPKKQGDCYSLKKVFQYAGLKSDTPKTGFFSSIKELIKPNTVTGYIKPNMQDAEYLKEVLDVYYEFPPVIKQDKTWWGDNWDDKNYPTPLPLFDKSKPDYLKLFEQEAIYYTWICLAKLK
jgi:hypothetical protein